MAAAATIARVVLNRHEAPHAAEATDVARAAFVINDFGGHEQMTP